MTNSSFLDFDNKNFSGQKNAEKVVCEQKIYEFVVKIESTEFFYREIEVLGVGGCGVRRVYPLMGGNYGGNCVVIGARNEVGFWKRVSGGVMKVWV
jgi:hypothetical protein